MEPPGLILTPSGRQEERVGATEKGTTEGRRRDEKRNDSAKSTDAESQVADTGSKAKWKQ